MKELKSNPEIKLRPASKLQPPCRENTFPIIENSIGVKFEENIKAFYGKMNGVNIIWDYNKNIAGEINIIPIMDAMLEEYDKSWKSDMKAIKSLDDPKFQAFIQKLFSLEIYDTTADGTLRVVMEIDKTTKKPQSPKLWLWHLAGERFPLTLDFEKYIQMLLKTRGFYGWPYFFIDLKKCDFEEDYFANFFAASCADALPKMKEFLAIMPKLFPETDFSEFDKLQKKIIENHKAG